MRHLQSRPPESTLDVEPLVGLTTIQDTLVAPDLHCHVVERLYQPQP